MDESERDPESYLPLTAAAFHVLVALADGERHGYGILKEVEQRTAGAVRLSAGTLYGLVKRLLADGWIAEAGREPGPGPEDERRRYYRLSGFGRRVARAEAERLARMVGLARDKRLLDGWGPA